MKYILAVCLMCVAVSALANPEIITLSDSIAAADSATVRADTAWGDWTQVSMSGLHALQFFITMTADTNWADDSCFVRLQWSPDRSNVVTTWNLDTLLAAGTTKSSLNVNPDDSIFPNWYRPYVIHWDSIGAGAADSALVNTAPYDMQFDIWIIQWKY